MKVTLSVHFNKRWNGHSQQVEHQCLGFRNLQMMKLRRYYLYLENREYSISTYTKPKLLLITSNQTVGQTDTMSKVLIVTKNCKEASEDFEIDVPGMRQATPEEVQLKINK